jgi:DNA-binding PadR family transcriptional regulator
VAGRFDKAFNPWTAFFGAGSPGFGRPGGFRWRVFDRGDLKYVILELLSDRSMHGYEVMRALEERSCGCYTASAGSVYPTLQVLQDEGYVRSEQKEGRKIYSITDDGRAFLDRNRDRVDDILDRVADLARHFSGSQMTGLTRSFVRLAHASFERAVRRPGNAESLARLRDILEQAARDVEAVDDRQGGEGR